MPIKKGYTIQILKYSPEPRTYTQSEWLWSQSSEPCVRQVLQHPESHAGDASEERIDLDMQHLPLTIK